MKENRIVTQEEIDQLVQDQFVSMIKENSVKMSIFMVGQFGKQAVSANADEVTYSQEMTIEKNRYKVTVVVNVEPVK